MDLSSLLNGGNAGLTTEDLLGLLHSDNFEKLDKISNAVFQYPSVTKDTYYFFDIFIQLLLSILNNIEESMQHTKPMIMESLRTCVKGILEQEGFNWLLAYPHHVSLSTWNQLKVSTDKTLLRHLYGLQLGLKKQDSIELGAWTRAILQFLRVQSPTLTCHIWLNLWYLDEQHRQQQQQSNDHGTNICLMFLSELESLGATDMLMDVFPILENGDKQKLIDQLETHLGDAIVLHRYSQDEMVVALMHFGNLVRSNKILYPRIKMSLDRFVYNTGGFDSGKSGKKSKGKKTPTLNIEHNTLVKNGILGELSGDIKERTLQVQRGTKWWLQQMGTLLPIEFNLHLEELISILYPSANRRVLDFVLMDWAARDPFGCHMELIVKNVMKLVDPSSYNSERAPFYSWIQMFDLSYDTRVSEIAKGYNIKTGAEINLSKFNTKHDVDMVNGLVNILQQMSLYSTPASDRFILDCIIVATPEIILGYVEWVVELLNNGFEHNGDDDNENGNTASTKNQSINQQRITIAEHLKKVLAHPVVMSIASLLVPTILLQASEHTIAWMTNKKTDWVTSPAVSTIQILMEYFSGGSHHSSKLLVTDLLRRKSKAYMDTLIDCLRKRMADPLPSSPHCRTWFTRHFLGPILSESSTHNSKDTITHGQQQQENDQNQPNVASQLLQTMLSKNSLFVWYFSTLVTLDRKQKLSTIDALAMSQHHTIYSVRGNGLADMIQKIVQLDVAQQQRIVNIWTRSWTATSTTTPDDNNGNNEMDLDKTEKRQQLLVDDTLVLQCIGLYDQAPAVVKQMMEFYMKLGIQSRVRNGEIVTDIPTEGSFTEKVMDLLMLSDAPEVDELFDLYLQLCYQQQVTWEVDLDEILSAVVRTVIILAEEIKLIYNIQSFGSGGSGVSDIDDGDETMGDELDEYTSMMDIDPAVVVDGPMNDIKKHNTSDAGKSRKQRKLLSQQREFQRQRFTAVARKKAQKIWHERQIENDQMLVRQRRHRKSMNKDIYRDTMMATLVQRLLNFILILLSESGGNSLCPNARRSLRNKLVRNLLLYEPLSTLNQLPGLPSDTVDDIHMIVGLCLEILQKDGETTICSIIERIIGGS